MHRLVETDGARRCQDSNVRLEIEGWEDWRKNGAMALTGHRIRWVKPWVHCTVLAWMMENSSQRLMELMEGKGEEEWKEGTMERVGKHSILARIQLVGLGWDVSDLINVFPTSSRLYLCTAVVLVFPLVFDSRNSCHLERFRMHSPTLSTRLIK